jgi:hypothetical protein
MSGASASPGPQLYLRVTPAADLDLDLIADLDLMPSDHDVGFFGWQVAVHFISSFVHDLSFSDFFY